MKLGSQAHTQHTCLVGQSSLAGWGRCPRAERAGKPGKPIAQAAGLRPEEDACGSSPWPSQTSSWPSPCPGINKALGQRTGYTSSGGRKRGEGKKKK